MIEIVDPRGHAPEVAFVPAPRVERSAVGRIGLLCNEASTAHGSMQFPRYLSILRRAIRERLGPVEFFAQTKPVLTRPAEPEQLDRFRGWHAVINGLGK